MCTSLSSFPKKRPDRDVSSGGFRKRRARTQLAGVVESALAVQAAPVEVAAGHRLASEGGEEDRGHRGTKHLHDFGYLRRAEASTQDWERTECQSLLRLKARGEKKNPSLLYIHMYVFSPLILDPGLPCSASVSCRELRFQCNYCMSLSLSRRRRGPPKEEA